MGLTAGLFATLFGVGGGIVMVPMLVLLLGFDPKVATAPPRRDHRHRERRGAEPRAPRQRGLGLRAAHRAARGGRPAGRLWIKDRISSRALTFAFASLLFAVAVWLAVKPVEGDGAEVALDPARGAAVAVIGLVAGSLAGLFGVGGGILFVPALTLIVGVPQLRAEGASLLAIIPVSLLGSYRQHLAGTVRWRAALTMGGASVLTAVAGAFLADATPPRVLRMLFAVLLVATAVQLVVRTRPRRAPAGGGLNHRRETARRTAQNLRCGGPGTGANPCRHPAPKPRTLRKSIPGADELG